MNKDERDIQFALMSMKVELMREYVKEHPFLQPYLDYAEEQLRLAEKLRRQLDLVDLGNTLVKMHKAPDADVFDKVVALMGLTYITAHPDLLEHKTKELSYDVYKPQDPTDGS